MTCIANNPQGPRFHVACYHRSLEPFMARGRELRTQGVQGMRVDSVRFREAKEGKLKLLTVPAQGMDWVMNAGTPKAHIMVTPKM